MAPKNSKADPWRVVQWGPEADDPPAAFAYECGKRGKKGADEYSADPRMSYSTRGDTRHGCAWWCLGGSHNHGGRGWHRACAWACTLEEPMIYCAR